MKTGTRTSGEVTLGEFLLVILICGAATAGWVAGAKHGTFVAFVGVVLGFSMGFALAAVVWKATHKPRSLNDPSRMTEQSLSEEQRKSHRDGEPHR
jgi:hypothetical protein